MSFFHSNKALHPGFKYLLIFMGIYCGLQLLYFMIPDNILKDKIYYFGIVTICTEVINFIAPQEQVFPSSNLIRSAKINLEIVRGCDGAGVMFLMMASILAFSTSIRHKLFGLLAGLILVFIVNQLRVILLYFIAAHKEEWFLMVHTYLAPTFIILVCCIFFAWWTLLISNSRKST